MTTLDQLTPEQRTAFDLIEQGKSIFLTGPGGTGKSFLLKTIYDLIPDRVGKHVAVTALTGCASVLLGKHSRTLHSWAGIGLGQDPAGVIVSKIIRAGKKVGKPFMRWRTTDVLIIDEVSMMTPELLEKLDAVARIIRNVEKPMGGIQVVFVGDFYQLPPVVKEGDVSFVFESPLWKEIVQQTVYLTKILRQVDPVFHTILQEARSGRLSRNTMNILEKKKEDKSWQTMAIRPTLLYTKRAIVDMVNESNLKALSGEYKTFEAKTVFEPTIKTLGMTENSAEVKYLVEKMDRDGQYTPKLYLKKGAQVMLVANINQEIGLVNGSRGFVYGYDENDDPIVEFRNGVRQSIPTYTWYAQDMAGVGRKQIPLKLAYAITIHKAQGATLDCALIDIGTSTFECGQAYVALSRVKNLESLYIWDVEPTAFRVHPKVLTFYESLTT